MSQVVEPDRPEPCLDSELAEALGHNLWVPAAPVLAGEDEPGVDPGRAPGRSLGVLREPVRKERPDGPLVEVDAPVLAARGLRRADKELMAVLDDLLPDPEEAAL